MPHLSIREHISERRRNMRVHVFTFCMTLSLASFGGAGGQHACEIASLLGIKTILIHRYSSILSAYGLALADR